MSTLRKALNKAYALGFSNSGEGYNGEYPFEGRDFEQDANWIKYRDVDLATLDAETEVPTHRHKKRGTEYVLIGVGKMQAKGWYDPSKTISTANVDMREVAIYRGTDGAIWVRPIEEFNDGRFEALVPPEPRS